MKREHRTLAFGVAAIIVILVVGQLVPTVSSWQRDTTTALQLAQTDSAIRQSQLSDVSRSRSRAMSLDGQVIDEYATLIHARSSGAGAASLVSELSEMAAEQGVSISAAQGTADTGYVGTLLPLSATLEATGNVRSIASWLAAIEGDSRRLAVRTLEIDQSDPQLPSTVPEVLRVFVVVDGLMRRPVAPVGKAIRPGANSLAEGRP